MIEPDGQNIFVVLHIVYCWKMQFPIKTKVLREALTQAQLRKKMFLGREILNPNKENYLVKP